VLAWGIVLELRASVRRAIDLEVLEERRRLARDLHDGVAQRARVHRDRARRSAA
jgi:signal transduction histidine kinase